MRKIDSFLMISGIEIPVVVSATWINLSTGDGKWEFDDEIINIAHRDTGYLIANNERGHAKYRPDMIAVFEHDVLTLLEAEVLENRGRDKDD